MYYYIHMYILYMYTSYLYLFLYPFRTFYLFILNKVFGFGYIQYTSLSSST